ncbi:substrate-binding domain-containing protein [Neobacillus cucumis]|uniref:substrate-binding domain-containing protein n=1 Tax=Neobacillus cucumis TaxID=1740721 RepID=UPI002E1F0EA5|nr:substrate-binding domain-containing protein [Neobacillus cucumis]
MRGINRLGFLFLFVALVILLIFTYLFGFKHGHGNQDNQGTRYVIGVSQSNLTEPWRVQMNEEIKKEAQKHKDLQVIYTDAAQSNEKQKKDINRLLGYGINLLIVSTNDTNSLTPLIAKVHKKIPVIVLGRAIDGYDYYTLFIGPDNQAIGRNAGQLVSDMLGGKQGNIVEIQGPEGSSPVRERSQGFKEVIQKHPNLHLYNTIVANWQKDEAEDKVTALLQRNPQINTIFAQSDAMALGAYKALQKHDIQGVKVIGVDGLEGTNGGLDLVKKGVLAGTFAYKTGGKESIQYAMDILKGKSNIPKKIILRVSTITHENVDQYVLNKSSYPKQIKSKKHIVLGFVQVGAESSWRLANTASIKKAAQDYGIDLKFKNANESIKAQISIIRKFIKQKVDVIAFSPIVQTGYEPILKEAKDAGIPVVLVDRDLDLKDNDLWLTSIGSDFEEEGKRAARWLLDATKGIKNNINIVELEGTTNSSPTVYRKKGFEEELPKNSNKYHVIASKSANFTKEEGKTVTTEFLRKFGDKINVVFAHNDDMALGAIEAIEAFGKKPGKDIKVISVDATQVALNNVYAGKLNVTVECNPLLGPYMMRAIINHFHGKELPVKIITEEGIFTVEDDRSVFFNRPY